MVGSASGMRQAVSQAIHHCPANAAFGQLLIDQPLMQNVLADLALEAEAAITLAMWFAYALDHQHQESESCSPVWAPQSANTGSASAPNHAYEAMECIGGSGVMETSMMPRLFRESPVNAIWEGSGNVQCLDMLRALGKTPDTLTYFAELKIPGRTRPPGCPNKSPSNAFTRVKKWSTKPDPSWMKWRWRCRPTALSNRKSNRC